MILRFTLLLFIAVYPAFAEPLFMFNETNGNPALFKENGKEVKGVWKSFGDGDVFIDEFTTVSSFPWVHISVKTNEMSYGNGDNDGLLVLVRKNACVKKSDRSQNPYEVEYHNRGWQLAKNKEVISWHDGEAKNAVLIHRQYPPPLFTDSIPFQVGR